MDCNVQVLHIFFNLKKKTYCFLWTAPPSVSNVQVIGEAVEGCTIRGVGEYFGGRQGPIKFEWLREDKDTGLVFIPLYCSTIELIN